MRLLYRFSDPVAYEDPANEKLVDLYRHPLPDDDRLVWLRSNFVTSLDGSIRGVDGRSGSISTSSDQHVYALHRAHADAILVGAQTVRAEGYRAVDLTDWQRSLRAAEGLADFPALVVVSRSLDLDPAVAVNGDEPVGPVVIFTTPGKDAAQIAPFTEVGIEVVQIQGKHDAVDLEAAIGWLAGAGCRRLLCEGGSRLHRDLLAADLLDEMSLTLAPVMVGGDGPRTTAGALVPSERAFELRKSLLASDGSLFLTYFRKRVRTADLVRE